MIKLKIEISYFFFIWLGRYLNVKVCPTCRVVMTNCVSQVAATIIQRIQHPCDFAAAGCPARCDINRYDTLTGTIHLHLHLHLRLYLCFSISRHEESCGFRLVRCPVINVPHILS